MGVGTSITNTNFETEVLKSSIPVLVDFWADWCTPCKMIAPVLEQLAAEYADRLKIANVNVDEENDLAGRHGVTSIPTMVIYKGGQLVRQQTGALPKYDIETLFKDLL